MIIKLIIIFNEKEYKELSKYCKSIPCEECIFNKTNSCFVSTDNCIMLEDNEEKGLNVI